MKRRRMRKTMRWWKRKVRWWKGKSRRRSVCSERRMRWTRDAEAARLDFAVRSNI